MDPSDDLTSMTTILNKLRDQGYGEDFQMSDQGMTIKKKNVYFQPEDLVIRQVFRFEGASNPDDMAVVYQIESKDGYKGAYVDAFGTYADGDPIKAAEFLKKVKTLKDH